ncbi:MAG: hypothetical protein GY723_09160 [bacterium]|nr:hypothetical protein [bacterium]
MAITSTGRWQRQLGQNWIRLHRLAHLAGVLAVLHFLWLAKAELVAPLAHAAVLGLLLGLRRLPRRGKTPAKAST